ncbi:hypothetical protein B0H10DRAFT_1948168 [Mycena sp. CBHHK59/15]|nr:hypothetical protein B0H10DRAFT_1948168 [Mycena sp. CBHHK59/15]
MQGTLPTSARLLALPPELLDAIALHVATRPPNLGLPTGLPPLFRTCRALAARAGPALEARVWRAKFTPDDDDDDEHAGRGGAARRRAAQLRHACAALRVLRTGDVHAPGAGPALHAAYRLLLGDDARRRNRGQLVWAGAEEFALRYVRDRLYEGRWAEGRKGWPRGGVDGEGSDAACALSMPAIERLAQLYASSSPHPAGPWRRLPRRTLWGVPRRLASSSPTPLSSFPPRSSLLSAHTLPVDRIAVARARTRRLRRERPPDVFFLLRRPAPSPTQKVRAEPEALRRHLMALLLPFVVVPFRYASTLCPPHHFVLPLPAAAASDARTQYTTTIPTTHGAYPIYATSPPSSASNSSSSSTDNNSDDSGFRRYDARKCAPVLPAPPARLLFFARLGLARMGIPPELPLTRADAIARWTAAQQAAGGSGGSTGMPIRPTQADIVEKNARPAVRFPRGGDWAARGRGRACAAGVWGRPSSSAGVGEGGGHEGERDGWEVGRVGKVYELGSFTGLWAGTMVMSFEHAFNALLSSPTGAFPPAGLAHDDLVAAMRPVYMRLAEHRAYSPNLPAPPPDAAASTLGAGWLPPGARVVGAEVRVPVRGGGVREEAVYAYETVRADGGVRAAAHDPEVCAGCLGREARGREERRRAGARGVGVDGDVDRAAAVPADADAWWDGWDPLAGACDGVLDVVFTGATDARHGMAWHHYEYTGRVRPWDGLIGILMKPRDASLGLATYFLSGHLVGRDTFEGTWQMVGQDVRAPSWSGSVCLARGEE